LTKKPDLNLEHSTHRSISRAAVSINLVLEIEEHFGFELTDSESASIATVGDLINQIKVKTATA